MKAFLRNRITHVIFAVVLMFFIISLSVTLTLNLRQLYYHDIKSLNIEEDSGYSYDVIKENYDVLIDYMSLTGPDRLEFPDLGMSNEGRIHFEEVKVIFLAFEKIAIVTGIISLVGIILMLKNKFIRFFKYAAILTVAVPSILGILVASNWDKAFVVFHEIAFNNDFWIFDYKTDPVISILPDTFFFHCAFFIIGSVIAGSVICFIVYLLLKRRWYPKIKKN